jgi:hypothetical protein
MIEKYDEEELSPGDILFNQKPVEKQSIYRVLPSVLADSIASEDLRSSVFTKKGFRHYHQQCFNMEFQSEDIINLAKE